MIGNYSEPARDPRFDELDILIAEQNRLAKQMRPRKNQKMNPPLLTEAEHTQKGIERAARLKREAGERMRARKLLVWVGAETC